jgi:hypothetical protein
MPTISASDRSVIAIVPQQHLRVCFLCHLDSVPSIAAKLQFTVPTPILVIFNGKIPVRGGPQNTFHFYWDANVSEDMCVECFPVSLIRWKLNSSASALQKMAKTGIVLIVVGLS